MLAAFPAIMNKRLKIEQLRTCMHRHRLVRQPIVPIDFPNFLLKYH